MKVCVGRSLGWARGGGVLARRVVCGVRWASGEVGGCDWCV